MRRKGVRQHDMTDCGAACLVFVAAHYGHNTSIVEAAVLADTDANGTSVYGMLNAAEKMGFDAHAVRCDADHLLKLDSPAIAHIISEQGHAHFVVISRIRKEWLYVMDPAYGRVVKQNTLEFVNKWTGVLILLSPGNAFCRKPAESIRSRLLAYVGPKTKSLALIGLLAITQAACAMIMPVYIKATVDGVAQKIAVIDLGILTLLLTLSIVLHFAVSLVKGKMVLKICRQLDTQTSARFFENLLALPRKFTDRFGSAEILNRLNDSGKLSGVLIHLLVEGMVNSITLVACLIMLMFFSWKLGLCAMLLASFYVFMFYYADRIHEQGKRKILSADVALEENVVQVSRQLLFIKQLSAGTLASHQLKEQYAKWLKATHEYLGQQLTLYVRTDLIGRVFIMMIVALAAMLTFQRELSSGGLVSVFAIAVTFSAAANLLLNAGSMIREVGIAAERYFEFVSLPDYQESETKMDPSFAVKPFGISVRNVTFSFKDDVPIFSQLNFAMKAGDITGIAGANGIGKSTLFLLLQRIYDHYQGEILVNEIEIRTIHNDVLRDLFAVVPQTDVFFHDTIRKNICLDRPVDEEWFDEVCERTGVSGFLGLRSLGMDDILDKRGENLSGGEKRKLSLARALYRNAPILLLDEPTAGVDHDSEQKIMQTIEWYKNRGNTVIFITHSDTALKICDNIVQFST